MKISFIYLFLLSSLLFADWDEAAKVVASDRAASDFFGISVSISGDYAIVGAHKENHDANGENELSDAGAAYMFKTSDGGATWTQVQKIVASDRAASDRFGSSVSISGNYAIVGASFEVHDASGGNALTDAGSAYIFKTSDSGASWTQVQKIVASDRAEGDRFGVSVSISGDYAIVGAYIEDHDASGGNALTDAGSAYMFKTSDGGASWTQKQKIVASDRAEGDYFAFTVSISGNYAIVGAYSEDHDASGGNELSKAGSAYLFKTSDSGETWSQTQKIVASDRAASDLFGGTVSISGNYAIVGAHWEDHDASGGSALSDAGSAYMFQTSDSGASWTQVQKLVASDRASNDQFGRSLSISGDYAIVGAYLEDHDASGGNELTDAGSVYFSNVTVFATAPSAGNGTEGSPYEIANLANLRWLSETSSEWASGKYFIQTADIDATETSVWNSSAGFSSIGNNTTKFQGNYDGQDYSVSNLFIDRSSTDYIGLFGYTDGATISNLGLTDTDITGKDNTGALIGYSYNTSSVTDCYSTGSITGVNSTGGLAGYNSSSSTIDRSYSTSSVSSTGDYVGGLLGYSWSSTFVRNCYSTGSVTGVDRIGGLVGYNSSNATVSNCYSKGSVSGTTNVGGLIGDNFGYSISNSFWDTQTSSQSSSDGGTGKTTSEMKDPSTFTGAGWDFEVETSNGTNSYWDMDNYNRVYNDGYPFLSWQNGSTILYNQAETPSGSGTEGSPYDASTPATVVWLTENTDAWSGHIELSGDLDLTGADFTPIGTSSTPFTGTFNGGGYTLDGLTIDGSSGGLRVPIDNVGFFGYVNGGTISNIKLTDVTVSGGDNVGVMVGYLTGAATIENCYVTGTVTGTDTLGGFVGNLYSTGGARTQVISSSYSDVDVTGSGGNSLVGGFTGQCSAAIDNCYSIGGVSNAATSGGFAGKLRGSGSLTNCYSTGSVSGTSSTGGFLAVLQNNQTVSNCFWDTQTSGESSSAAGTGKTTSEMKDYTTFTAAGWDFVSETANGTNDYWDADQLQTVNNGYPILSWQTGADQSLPVTLSSFTANATRDGEIELVWITESEIENIGFIIERKDSNEETWTENASYLTEPTLQGQGSVTYRTEYRYTDNTVEPNTQYDYRLADVSYTGEKTYHAVTVLGIEAQSFPEAFRLQPAYPNPFNPTTTIQYELINDGQVTLKIYDIQGREVTTLINQHRQSGFHTAQWNADTHPSGTYFLKLTQGENTSTQKIILLK